MNFNARGEFAAVQGFAVTYPGNGHAIFTWNASPVSEVTHYEMGVRSGNTIVAFTGDLLSHVTTVIDDIEGVEMVNGFIRIDKNTTSFRLGLGLGFQGNLALRAVVVNDLGIVTDNSASANRAVNVRR